MAHPDDDLMAGPDPSVRVVILVPRRAGQADRDLLWTFCREHWTEHHPTWPIYEGHHEAHEGPFSRSAAMNRAAAAAGEWDVAVCIDSDVLADPAAVWKAVGVASRTGGPVLAYDRRHHLNRNGSRQVMNGFTGNWSRHIKATFDDACSSAYVVTRDVWDAVGGFDELFVGWGWEDVAFRCATEVMSGHELVKIPAELWHLWHTVSSENNGAEPTFVANRERGARYNSARWAWDCDAIVALLDEARAGRAPEPVLGPTVIPRILHRTVPAQTTAEVEGWWARWRDLHPGWVLMTHRDPMNPAAWPETGHLWGKCHHGSQLAGLIRLEALWRWGGVYVDSDVEPLRSLEPLLHLPGFAAWEDANVIPDAVLGSTPGHPAVAVMLDQARRVVSAGGDAWASGPGVTTAILPGRTDWLTLPPGAFYPYHYHQLGDRGRDHYAEQPWCYAVHHWHGLKPAGWVASRR